MRDRGDQPAQIAQELDCTVRTVSRLTTRKFTQTAFALIVQILSWTHGKNPYREYPVPKN